MKKNDEKDWSMCKGYIVKDPYGNIHIVTGTHRTHRNAVEWWNYQHNKKALCERYYPSQQPTTLGNDEIRHIWLSENTELVDWISFDHSNSSGSTPVKPRDHKEECPCHFDNWEGEDAHTVPRYDCTGCKGTGERIRHECGASDWKVLATNAKDYITELFRKALKEIEK